MSKTVRLPPADLQAQDKAWSKVQRDLSKKFPPQPFVLRIVVL